LQITSENPNLDTDQPKTQHEARLIGRKVLKNQNMLTRWATMWKTKILSTKFINYRKEKLHQIRDNKWKSEAKICDTERRLTND
jgi:hypothetical protein